MHGETCALTDISFSVKKGEFIAIVGPSGCGKSTLLSLIAGLLTPESGKVLFPMLAADESPKIGYMLQHDHLFEWRTIYQNVILGLEINHLCTPEKLAKVETYLKDYGLWEFRDKRPSELSGGMKQRAALIRTLALEPELLLLDEPFSALDYQTRLQVSADISRIIRAEKKTALLITHDLSEAISIADRVIVFSSRPATVKIQIPIRLTLPDDSMLAARNAPEFSSYFNLLWEELHDDTAGTIYQKA
ncbi:MAG: ATP-binding cassette domain-containing protein [Lachnospiraceae bacterium]|nr:ATP-binding cassette domain-containing protein [Lachnospiraceae bacterium]